MDFRNHFTGYDKFHYLTITCFQIIPFFETVNLNDYIYRCFRILESKKILTCGYVIMPNHLHSLVFTKIRKELINEIIGETKRFMAYEIVSRIKRKGNFELLEYLEMAVSKSDARKKKLHNVFETSSDMKEMFTENFIKQKLNYMYKNPVSGKWRLADDYVNYEHSSAGYYELGIRGTFEVIHYEEVDKSTQSLPHKRLSDLKIFNAD